MKKILASLMALAMFVSVAVVMVGCGNNVNGEYKFSHATFTVITKVDEDGKVTETKTYTAWSATNLGKLKSEEVCIGDTESAYTSAGVLMTEAEKQAAISNYESYYYKNYIRMYTDKVASLMCDTSGNKTTSAKVYPLTVDEVVFAGGKPGASNYTYYLRENATSNWWWTLSPSYFYGYRDYAFYVGGSGAVYSDSDVYIDDGSLRPAVSLASGAKIATGDGTKDSPYTIQ